ncbi:glycosyltransferase [Chitinimonas koreensis]|uniref:glycosyltransferase n=1 Tax=Chitinimonas koreensis TaxID=356302 RepID=UPI000426BEF1|nr:glycosyltransferase [Chitinimonas koreensis]QNM97370.1 glycosyltransferase [Chitinimonas koreensis]
MAARLCFFGDGGSVHTQRWVCEMVRRGFHATLISRRGWSAPGVDVITMTEHGHGPLHWVARAARMRTLVRRLRPDLVHGHYLTSYGFWAAASGHRPLVLTAWGSDVLVTPQRSRLMRQLTGWTLRRADLVTADSQDALEAIARYRPRARLEQIQWGVDLARFGAGPAADDDGVFRIVSLRSWEPLYNIDRILAGFARASRQRPDRPMHLHLLGGGSLEAALRRQADELGIAAQVSFHGQLDEAALIALLQRAQLSVSIPGSDATAMSLLESMAAERPVLVSDLAANRQWVDPRGGRLVPPHDVDAIAAAMLAVLDTPAARRAEMGRHNRAIVAARASRAQEMDRMAELYQALLAKRR